MFFPKSSSPTNTSTNEFYSSNVEKFEKVAPLEFARKAPSVRSGKSDSLFGFINIEKMIGPRNQQPFKISKKKNSISRDGYYVTAGSHQNVYYQITALIGIGTFGIVHSATNQANSLVAVKTKTLKNDAKTDKQFAAELQALYYLKHSNIVSLIGVEFNKHNLIVSLVLECINGTDLEKIINLNGTLHESQIKVYTKQILDGVAYLHANNVIHRDLKSSNIMIVNNHLVKIIDFGMAKTVHTAYENQIDLDSVISGTLPYMAPELLSDSGYSDGRIDIWSLGVLVHEMNSGDPFCKYDENKTLLMSQMPGEFFSVQSSKLSPNATSFIQNCLVKNYKYRPTSNALKMHPFIN